MAAFGEVLVAREREMLENCWSEAGISKATRFWEVEGEGDGVRFRRVMVSAAGHQRAWSWWKIKQLSAVEDSRIETRVKKLRPQVKAELRNAPVPDWCVVNEVRVRVRGRIHNNDGIG